jgi:hypothetical protein
MGTEYSPFYLNYGYHPAILADLPRQIHDGNNETADDFAERMNLLYENFARILHSEQRRVAARENVGREPTRYKPGDLVLVNYDKRSRRAGYASKLDPRFVGPYRVLRQVNPDTYEIALPSTSRAYPVFHAEFLRPYHLSRDEYQEDHPDVDDENDFPLEDSRDTSSTTIPPSMNSIVHNSRSSHLPCDSNRELRRM